MSAPATLDDLRKFVWAGVRRIQRGFVTADDDWDAIFFVQTPSGVEVISLANPLFKNNLRKDVVGEVLRRLVVELGAYRYALLLNTHAADRDTGMTDEQVERVRAEEIRIEDIPGAREMLVLTVGDAETEQLWIAEIKVRPPLPRKLGAWERLEVGGDASYSGRFAGLNEYLARPRASSRVEKPEPGL